MVRSQFYSMYFYFAEESPAAPADYETSEEVIYVFPDTDHVKRKHTIDFVSF